MTKGDQLVWQQSHVKTMTWRKASVVLQSNDIFQVSSLMLLNMNRRATVIRTQSCLISVCRKTRVYHLKYSSIMPVCSCLIMNVFLI